MRADADGAAGPEAFQHQRHPDRHPNTAAAQRRLSSRLLYRGDPAIHAIMVRPPSPQGLFRCGNLGPTAWLEVGIEGFVHAAVERHRDARRTKVVMLDRIDHGRQPAESHLPAVAAPLPRGGSRHCRFIEPDI